MIHVKKAFSTEELAAIVLPPASREVPEAGASLRIDPDTGNGWLRISYMDWHVDDGLQKWSICLLVQGRMGVRTELHEACMMPGDIVAFDAHQLHMCMTLNDNRGLFVIEHADDRPTAEQARAAIEFRLGELAKALEAI